jgi:hypothetical protein
VRFLEQTFNLGPGNPHSHFRKLNEVGSEFTVPVNEALGVDADMRDRLLSWGVSSEGEGKAAYLRTSYARLPQNRGRIAPMTTAQTYGFNIKTGVPGKSLAIGPARQPKSAVKNFFARTPLSSLPRPDNGRLRDDAVYVDRVDG